MKFPRFQSLIVIALTFFSTALFSQTNGTPLLKTVFTLDSLAGFDEAAEKTNALNKGLYGMEFNAYIYQQKRIFINDKYHLPFFDYEANYVANYKKYGGAFTNNAPCVNEDFEANSFTGWALSQGTTNAIASGTNVYGACIDNPCPTTISTGSLASIVSTPYSDAVINFTIPNSPFGGSKVARLNTQTTANGGSFQFKATKMTQNFPVTVNNSLFEFAYFAVMDASSPHLCCEQPYMYVKMRDCFGNLLTSCPVFSITVPGTGCSGTGPTSWTTTAGIARSNGWQQYSIDLASYIGCNITIEVTVGHCQFGGHFAYAYFDSRCNQMNFNVNSNLVNAPSTSPVSASVACATTATLTAPVGLGPYLWNGPSGSGITSNTNQVISTNVAGSYSISMNPVGICNPINRVISLSFPPPTTVTASPASLCSSGTNTSSTLSASGASSYTWSPGGSTLSTIVVSPTTTTIYTLTAKTGTCIGTFTTLVTVNTDPVISVLSSNFTVCPGQTATLSASGASSYAWNPGALSGSLVIVSPTVTTSYTTVGTASTGCTGSAVTTINASAAIILTLTPFSPTYNCAGTPVNIVAGGATTFTWLPTNVTGFFQTLTPSVTTIYTVIGASGACTNSANITLSVNPGPSITIVSTPSIVCPGLSTTLTASAPLAIGNFTWAAPISSNANSVVVTPTVAGGYSVSAKDAMSCVSTFTVNPNISSLPSLSITPASPTLCIGSSVSLNASGAATYTWSTGSNANSISVSPTVNTTYSLIGANAAGCTVQATSIVTVLTLPLVNATASPTALCAGSCATISPTGASTYTISGGSAVVCPLVNTNYTVTGTNAAGCTSTPVVVGLTVNPSPTLIATAAPSTICLGASSTLSVTGASTYTWSTGSNAASISVSPTLTTTYTVTGATAFGCTTTQTVQVTVIPVPAVSITPASASVCAGSSVLLTASGATSYTWNPGGLTTTAINVSPVSNTTYTAIGSTAGCSGQNTVLVTVSSIPVIGAVVSPSNICTGSCATITPSGGTSYTYSSGSAVVCPTINTSYTVTGSNAAGCVGNAVVVTVSVNAAPTISVTASPTAVCPGNSSNLSASGAVSYTWLPMNVNGSSISVTPTSTTVYTVIGANGLGCTSSKTVSVTFIPTPIINASATPSSICIGNNVALSATGATGFIWMPGALSGANVFVTPTVSTNYTVTGTTSGCTGTAVVAVIVNPLPSLSITATPTAICVGGSATLTASGAATYTWNTGSSATSIVVSPASTTTYSLIGTSAAGCVGTMVQLSLPVNSLPVITASATPTVICSSGNATLSAGGGISYTWQPVNLTGASVVVNPSITTTYTVSGINAAGCSGTSAVQVNVSTPPSVFINASTSSVCVGNVAVLTGSGAVNYTWLPGGSTAPSITVSPVSTTIYTLFGANAAGCIGQNTFTLFVQPNPIVTATASPTSVCAGSSATLIGGGASVYTWQPINVTGSLQIVTPSITTIYTLFASQNGCSGVTTVTLNVNPLPIVSASATPASICAGSTATLSAGGATAYTWSPGPLIGSNVTVNPPSTTIYTVIGSAGTCTASATLTLVVSPLPTITVVSSASAVCAGQSFTLNANGSSSLYTWSPSGTGGSGSVQVYTPSVTTTYTVFGVLGTCPGFTTITVIVNSLPNLTAFASPPVICSGAVSTLTANGAVSYTWNPGGSTSNPVNVTPLLTTIYTVDGINAAGCVNSQTVSVTVNTIPTLSISASANPICSGSSATLTASGANTYSWNTGSTNSVIIVNPPVTTVYTLFGTNGAGCSTSTIYTLVVNPSPTLNIVASSPSVCAGFSVSLLGVGAPTFTWNPGGSTANPFFDTPTSSTIYTVSSNLGSCVSSSTILITVVPLPNVSVTASPSAVCLGQTTTLTASGALTYSWIPSLVGGSSFIDAPLVSTDYTVVGFDAAGCPNFATVSVNVLTNPTVSAIASSTAICIGNSATLTAGGATNYTWNPGNLTGGSIVVNPISSTVYTLAGDNGACAGITTVSLVVNALPLVNASAANSPLCSGNSVTLSATGANSYTWNPSGLVGGTVIDNPIVSTTYTVSGEDINGCIGVGSVNVLVNPNPTLSIVSSATTICFGSVVTMTASGALNYTWSPNNQNAAVITESPLLSTLYSVSGIDANGCIGTETIQINVVPIPTISIAPQNSSVCIGSSATLTALGAINYTWLPSGSNGSVLVTSPLANTNYTVIGDNGGNCAVSATVDVFVNPLPANVTATSSGTISCSSPTASLFGNCTDPNISYAWSGPSGYTSGSQNATVSGVWGDFTLTVTNTITGCSNTATVNIPSDNSIPLVNPIVSGSITCAVSAVTITAVNTTSNPAYSWTGPGSFTSSVISPTVSVAGTYTIVVTDLVSTCTGSALISVGIHTRVEATASITPASCSGGVSNNDGKINVLNFTITDKYDIVVGTSYTGTATYASAVNVPTNGIITNNLANPSTTVAYTIRLFDAEGCKKDSTLYLIPVNCSFKTLGIAKSASEPSYNDDGTYDVSYKVVVKNYDTGILNGITLTENLAATFAAAQSFTVMTAPLISPVTSDLTANTAFNGSTQTNLLQNSANTLASGKADTVSFTVRVQTALFFVPFKNTVTGTALNSNSQSIVDSSQAGLDPDPDNDKNPFNNNLPTPVTFTPNTFFGITKVGSVEVIDKTSFDLSYTVTVHNLGNDTIRNVSLNDSLFGKTIQEPATYSMKSAPVLLGTGLTANPAFDGKTDIRLTLANQSKLPPNTVSSISFVIHVIPGTVTSISNSAYGNGLRAKSATQFETVSDTSGSGVNPDVNNNNIWNEPEDNLATVILVPAPTQTLFIPEGFSPNGDNINDWFVIQGLPTDGNNSITFYNRWGNKVYENSNYDNSWDGTSNAKGTLGKDKLPVGTYYYILDMKNSGIKPISGFITIEYK